MRSRTTTSNRLGATLLILATLVLASCGGGGGSGGANAGAPSGLTYPPLPTYTVGDTVTPVTPTVTGTVTTYTLDKGLPIGFTFDAKTGQIAGEAYPVTPTTTYTVTATNAAGSTNTTISITVNDKRPVFTYDSLAVGYSVGIQASLQSPTMDLTAGGPGLHWSIAPALPPGLSFNEIGGRGVISGTPTAVSPKTTYVVTAGNSGGTSSVNLTIAVDPPRLLDQGLTLPVAYLNRSGNRMLGATTTSFEGTLDWMLWDFGSTAKLAEGVGSCYTDQCKYCRDNDFANCDPELRVAMAGAVFVVETGNGLEIHSVSDSHVVATVSGPTVWWQLAADGSYVCAGDASGLTVWSTTDGSVILTHSGDYSTAKVFAAAGEIRSALSPAGQNVIETLSIPSGTRTVSPAFQGTFNAWFVDGEHFLTNIANTVWTYSKIAVQQGNPTMVPSTEHLTGQGGYFWVFPTSGVVNTQLSVYAIGSSSAVATYPLLYTDQPITSGNFIGVLPGGTSQVSIIDLSGATPTRTNYPVDVNFLSLTAFSAASATDWVGGNAGGIVLDGSGLPAVSRYFGYGAAGSVAASPTRFAVTTALGKILIFNTGSLVMEGSIDFPSSKLLMSSDGAVLVALGSIPDSQQHFDNTIKLFSLPSGAEIKSYPYPYGTSPQPLDVTLSASGTVLGRVLTSSSQAYERVVTAEPSGTPIWSLTSPYNNFDNVCGLFDTIRLSPDGTLIAASNGDCSDVNTATNIVANGTLTTATSGWAVGWIDNNRLLLDSYATTPAGTTQYASCRIVDPSGQSLGCASALPELSDIQPLTSDTIFSSYAIYSVSTGARLWESADGAGAAAGGRVVVIDDGKVLVQTY